MQSQNKNYRRLDGFNQINRELKSKNKYSVNQTRTRQQNVVHRNGTTYIGKNFPNNFLEQGVSDKAGGTPQNNIQNANQEHPKQSQDGRNVGERNLNEARNNINKHRPTTMHNHDGGVVVSVLVSSAVDRGFEP